nr:hypothetical protein [Tanacetum cinerariifolium]
MMADQRTMAQLIQSPTEGYEDAIVVPVITADNFELKHGLLTLVQNKQFLRHDKEDPHAHIRYFNKITSTLKFPNVLNTLIKLMLFPFSLEGAARIWLEKEPTRSIFTWDDLVSKIINQFFPPFKTTNLRNEITNFQQRFDESFSEAWNRFKDLLRSCPHHGFSKLHQLDTFYNALNSKDQDSLNSAAGGNFLDKMPRECLAIIKSKSKVCYSCNKPVVAKVSMNTSTFGISPDVAELKDMVKALLLDKKSQNQAPTTVKAVEESFNYNQGNTSYRPSMMSNQIRPPGFPPVPNNQNVQLNQRNNQNHFNQNQNWGNNFNDGPVYQPPVFQPPAYQAPVYQAPAPQTQGVLKEDFLAYVKASVAVMRNMQTQGQNMQNQLTNLTELLTKFEKSNNASTSSSSTLPNNTIANPRSDLKAITTQSGVSYDGPQIPPSPSFLPKVVENEPEATKDIVHPTNNGISAPMPNQRPSIPYPSRMQDQKLRDKANDQREKFFQIFKDLNFNIIFANALILMPKFGPSIKSLLTNKDKLSLADLDASINLMPLSVWNKLSLPDLTPTCMTLDLADRSISRPVGVAEDVYVKVGTFHFPVDIVVVDFDVDPRVPLILRRSFLNTGRALIDVFEGELTLRVDKEAITFNLNQTSRYSANYSEMTAKRIDVIDMACEEYSHKVLGFYDVIMSGNPTPYCDPIVSTTSSTLTPFGNSDFLLEEVDAFLAIEDDPASPEVGQSYLDFEGDMCRMIPQLVIILEGEMCTSEAFLNDDPSLPPPNQGNYLPEVRKELKIYEAKSDKSSIDEPPEVELNDLPPHLEFAFLEGDDKLIVIIVKDLSVEDKTALIMILKSHKRAIAWKLSDIKGIDHEFCTYKILMEEDFEPAVQHQRRVNPKIHNVIKQEEKPTFTCPYGTFAYRRMPFGLCNAPGTFQRFMIAIFHDMIEKTMEVFMDDFSVFRNSFQSCDHIKVQLNEIIKLRDQAYENSLIYKEKTKRLHDSKIKDHVFNIGDRVFLFNSRLKIFSGKLKSRSGLFTISHVYPYGTVELAQPDGPNFKENGHRLKHYFGEDVPKLVVPDLQTFPKDH